MNGNKATAVTEAERIAAVLIQCCDGVNCENADEVDGLEYELALAITPLLAVVDSARAYIGALGVKDGCARELGAVADAITRLDSLVCVEE